MANNPFHSWTWFGKLWTWLFGSDGTEIEFVGNAPESSRGSGSGSTRPGSPNRRPDYSTDYGSSGQPLWESVGSEDSKGFFGSLGDPSTPIGNLISSLASRLTGTRLTGAEREANEFTANQAATNRQFESAEAEKARAWQEQQYLQYNSPAAQMRQFAEAGINPVMIAGGNMPAASTSTAAPAGNAGSSVSPSSPLDLVSSIISVLKTKAEIDVMRSQANKNNASAGLDVVNTAGQELANGILGKYGEAEADAKIRHLNKSIDALDSQMSLNKSTELLQSASAALQAAQAKSLGLDAVVKEWTNKFIDEWGVTPELAGQLMRSLAELVGSGLGHLLDGFFKNRKVLGSQTTTTTRGPKGTTVTESTSIPFPIPTK